MSMEKPDSHAEGERRLPAGKRGRPRRIDDAERRQSILNGAYEAFVELGFARTTTAMVAAKAKVSKRSIYETFSDKTELFAAVIRKHRRLILDLPRPLDEELSILDALVRIFRLDIDEKAECEREAILNLIVRESIQFPELSDYLYENEILRSREDLIAWLQAQARRGRLIVEDPLVCAGMLMDIVFGALLPHRRRRHPVDRVLRMEHVKKRLEIFLRGVQGGI